MDTSLRNALRLAITSCRRLLEDDFRLQLEGRYGIKAGKLPAPQDSLDDTDFEESSNRQAILSGIQHEDLQESGYEEALSRFIRESAFTTLNRLAALKLLEHPSRELVPELVGRKDQSKGYRSFMMVSPEVVRSANLERADGSYCLYLTLLFDDLSHAIGALFDRSLPQSILFPSVACLSSVLDLLNQPELAPAWAQDETIGWIYQYFTPPELRDQARKESSAPRNSYELSFRNQFYTPRYVVEFLSENTLARAWYEMRQGETALVDQCRYLIRPPDEPIPYREKRDPRCLRILDPACGSGHFLLYCFDLLLTIYQEAYEDPDLRPALEADYPHPEAVSPRYSTADLRK